MEPYKIYSLVNYAIATDGGSIALVFIDENNIEYWVSLDKGIDSDTYGKIFTSTNDKTPLSAEAEKQLILILENAAIKVDGDEDFARELISEIVSVVRQRNFP